MTNIGLVGFRRWGHVNLAGTIQELYKNPKPGAFHATRRNTVEFCSEALGGRLFFPESRPLYAANVVDVNLLPEELILEGFLPGRIAQRIAGGSLGAPGFGLGIAGIDAVLDIVATSYQAVLAPKEHDRLVLLRQVYARSFSDVPVPWILRLPQEKFTALEAAKSVKVVNIKDFLYNGGTFSEMTFAGRFSLQDFEVYADPDPRELSYTTSP